MASFPILEITDGTTTVSLLDPFFKLESWRPAIAQSKGGGTWQSSPLADGRRLVNRRFDNAIETFDLSASATTQDSWAHQYQELERLLEKAVQYWTASWQNTPVYLVSKTDCETEYRYALIYNYALPDINQVMRSPFASKSPGMVGFSLSLERGHWLANVPGEETCVEISGMGAEGHGTDAIFYPVLNTDDAAESSGLPFDTTSASIMIGNIGGASHNAGIVFRNVTIPQGSIIFTAQIVFKGAAADGGVPVFAIYGQDSDTAQAFSTQADWDARPLTSTTAAWSPGAWVVGVLYFSTNVNQVMQEIIDRPGWQSGNDMAMMIFDNGSPANIHRWFYTTPHAIEPPPELRVTYISAADAGRAATCDAEVFIANKHNYRGLTHVWYDDGGVFSANLLGSGLPYDLLPAVPAVGDVLYFGIEDGAISTITGGGPFFSLVFDLSVGQTGVTFGNSWEFWDSTAGPGWAALGAVRDNTDTTEPLDTAGVHSVHWEEEANWIPNAINGVTAYWIKLEVTAIAAPTPPTQQNREVYTINWPYVEVDAGQVPGDIAALLRVLLNNQGWYDAGANIVRIIMSLRSNLRGLDFTPYLNCSDQQEIPGINTVAGANTAFTTSAIAPTERVARYTPPGADPMTSRCSWLFNVTPGATPIISNQWQGSYHAFARVSANTADNFSVLLFSKIGDHIYYSSSGTVAVTGANDMEVVDLGRIDIPDGTGVLLPVDEIAIDLELQVSAVAGGAGEIIDLYDLILMPVDEMIIDASSVNKDDADGWVLEDYTCTFDSVLFPKAILRTLVKDENDIIGGIWGTKGVFAFLQSNRNQRLWFFMMGYNFDIWNASITLSARLQAFANARYLSLRGER